MNHNWNLIPQIVDLLDGHFEIIFFHFFLDIDFKIWVPRTPLSSLNLIPIFCIKNPESATISWTMLFALLAIFQSADTSPPVYSKPILMDRPSTYVLPLHLFSWRSPGGPLFLNFIRQLGISLLHSLAGVPHHLQKGITLYLTMESDKLHHIPLKGRIRRVIWACVKPLLLSD